MFDQTQKIKKNLLHFQSIKMSLKHSNKPPTKI